ncbi:cysteine-rich secretory protein 2-like [Paramacrobiotus metropolitanus]|uniref:cysteine-rich secretory protein 2-like n=1 Tax=Paramacrobiotus metropolitanus TaxID=2943436 RepID=UPI0024463273|nr:cysteine-rich secretory protein 2-like [Paramacrobiotus metropolitanus]
MMFLLNLRCISAGITFSALIAILVLATQITDSANVQQKQRKLQQRQRNSQQSQRTSSQQQAVVNSVSKDQITEIVNLHNKYRSSVKSRDMRKLKWNTDAAKSAQRWADTCPDGHNKDTDRQTPGFGKCGQNIAWRQGTAAFSWTNAINQWYNEVKYFRYCRQPTGPVGHYTQLMWANTSVVGCGVRSGCNNLGTNTIVYVCNYCNGGNIMLNNDPNSPYCPWKV